MFELWQHPPVEIFRLAKYLLGPPGVILFIGLVPFAWIVPRRAFGAFLLAGSAALLAFSWGPTFTILLLLVLVLGYALVGTLSRLSALAAFLAVEAVYLSLFHIPLARLPVLADPRFTQIFPGLLTDRELIFYSGLAFTNLRYLHLVIDAGQRDRLRPVTIHRYLLYLLYAPTYRLGPFVTYDYFSEEVDTARARCSPLAILRGLGEVLLGILIFELMIKTVDTWYFRPIAPDDGSYWYPGFYAHPPASSWWTQLGIYLTAVRYYLLVKAYSHVARGLSQMVGIRLPRNMDWPLLSVNLLQFWRRFHVTVSAYTVHRILKPVREYAGSPAVAVASAFVFLAFWHRPALHTLIWAVLQLLGIAVLMAWRRASTVDGPLRRVLLVIPFRVRQVCSVLVTLGFVAQTTPILLDIQFGGARLVEHLMYGNWW